MYSLKLPYYPQMTVMAENTPSGLVEISRPELYNVPLQNKVILRVDLLACLTPIIGETCLIYREYIYNIIAGKGDVATLFGHLYRRHKQLLCYVNDIATYGDNSVPLIDRCVEPLRNQVRNYETELKDSLGAKGAKYLVTTHGYLYVCYNKGMEVPAVSGGTCIC